MPFPNSVAARSGKYCEIRAIGKGAYGQVYYAIDNLGREVAVKEAIPSNLEFEHARAKFQKEAQIQAGFRHPNIIQVYHLEEDPESHELYLIAEYANAGSLTEHLDVHGPLTEQEAALVARDICRALEETSAKTIVHRDIKPSNILLVKDVRGQISAAKLGDFGIAQDLKARSTTVVPGMGYPGTILYMAPEQTNVANLLDVRADIYALGITLWEMLTCEQYKLLAQTGTPMLKEYNRATSASIAAIIARAVREKPAERYATPQAMARDLQELLEGPSDRHRTLAAAPTVPFERSAPERRFHVPRSAFIVFAMLLLGSLGYLGSRFVGAAEPVKITVAYSDNLKALFEERFAAFNKAGHTVDGRPIVVEGIPKASGELQNEMQQGTLKPSVWVPSSSAWLEIAKQTRPGLAISQRPVLRTPLTIGMWQPMAEALGWPEKAIGWSDVLALINDPQGWGKYGHPEWGRFTWGHTDPQASSTALSTVLAEFYATSKKTKGLTVADAQSSSSQQFLRQLGQGIKHYGYTTKVFTQNMQKYGMSYISAIPMEERQVVEFNKAAPATPLVAIYPREGSFWHDNPFIVLSDTAPEQRRAADQLYDFLLTPESQNAAMQYGYRPANTQVALGEPITSRLGVDPAQPKTLLEVPRADVLIAARNAWAANRKRANIVLVVDTSGSMNGQKIQEAKAGLDLFLSRLLPDDRVALVAFSDEVHNLVPLAPLSENRSKLQDAVQRIAADGGTAMYDALIAARPVLANEEKDPDRINALVLLSDGEDRNSHSNVDDFKRAFPEGGLPIFPIAYGKDADKGALQQIAEHTRTLLIEGSTGDINKVFQQMSQYF